MEYMSRFAIITNSIRRSVELVSRSLGESLSQDDATPVIFIDQNVEKLALPPLLAGHNRLSHQQVVAPGVSSARNLACYPADCEWLVFCDDDGYLERDYLSKLQRLIESRPDVDIFAGAIRRTDTGDFYSRRHAIGGDMRKFWNSKLLMGSNFVIRRRVFEELGKFDENLGVGSRFGSSEETDLAWNAYFHGKKMLYAPELVVYHVPPFSGDLDVEKSKAFRYGIGKGALVRKWLGRGHWIVLTEMLEMLVLPVLVSVAFFVLGRWKESLIRTHGLLGRIRGLFGGIVA